MKMSECDPQRLLCIKKLNNRKSYFHDFQQQMNCVVAWMDKVLQVVHFLR